LGLFAHVFGFLASSGSSSYFFVSLVFFVVTEIGFAFLHVLCGSAVNKGFCFGLPSWSAVTVVVKALCL